MCGDERLNSKFMNVSAKSSFESVKAVFSVVFRRPLGSSHSRDEDAFHSCSVQNVSADKCCMYFYIGERRGCRVQRQGHGFDVQPGLAGVCMFSPSVSAWAPSGCFTLLPHHSRENFMFSITECWRLREHTAESLSRSRRTAAHFL